MISQHSDSGIPPVGPVTVACWVVLSFLGAYAGPFGTYAHDFGTRLLYWTGVVVVSSLMGRGCAWVAYQVTRGQHRLMTDAITLLLMTAFFTPVLFLLTQVVLSPDLGLNSYLYFAQFVAIISACVIALRHLPLDKLHRHSRPEADEAPPRLARRLPEAFEGPILRLTVNDHFVDVVSPSGTHRLRLRFGDAIEEMDTVPGYSTHRSHWVAQQAIDGVERDAGRVHLRLVNGDRVPVSRSYRPGLEEAGIL